MDKLMDRTNTNIMSALIAAFVFGPVYHQLGADLVSQEVIVTGMMLGVVLLVIPFLCLYGKQSFALYMALGFALAGSFGYFVKVVVTVDAPDLMIFITTILITYFIGRKITDD